jgi:hypothetical protein
MGGGEIYLVEAKRGFAPMSEAPLLVFWGKVQGKLSFTRGVFVAAYGFTSDAIQVITRKKQANLFLNDGYDLTRILEGGIGFDAVLRHKLRLLVEQRGVLVRKAST